YLMYLFIYRTEICFFVSSRRRHTRFSRDWSSDVCSSDLRDPAGHDLCLPATDGAAALRQHGEAGLPADRGGLRSLCLALAGAEEIGRASCRDSEEFSVVCRQL